MKNKRRSNSRRGASRVSAAPKRKVDSNKVARFRSLTTAVLLWGSLLGFAWVASGYVEKFLVVDVERVAVNGEMQFVDRATVVKQVEPLLQDGFFFIDLAEVKERLEKIAWVYQVDVERVWPLGLQIKVVEQTPIALWNDSAYVNADGVLFALDDLKPVQQTLPRLHGEPGSEALMARNFMEFRQMLGSLERSISELNYRSGEGYSVVLDNGLPLYFGETQLTQKVQRFLSVYQRVFKGRLNDVHYVDLRYSNGLAVRWRDQEQIAVEELMTDSEEGLING